MLTFPLIIRALVHEEPAALESTECELGGPAECAGCMTQLGSHEIVESVESCAHTLGLSLCDLLALVSPEGPPMAFRARRAARVGRFAGLDGTVMLIVEAVWPLVIEHAVIPAAMHCTLASGEIRWQFGDQEPRPLRRGGLEVAAGRTPVRIFMAPGSRMIYAEHPATVWMRQNGAHYEKLHLW